MKDKELKEVLERVEQAGFNRGVLSILKEILRTMQETGMGVVSYKSIKALFEEYQKIK